MGLVLFVIGDLIKLAFAAGITGVIITKKAFNGEADEDKWANWHIPQGFGTSPSVHAGLSGTGLHYSPQFVETMGRVVKEFRSNAGLPIKLVTESDVLCDSCPRQKEGKCQKKPDSFRRITLKDADILSDQLMLNSEKKDFKELPVQLGDGT